MKKIFCVTGFSAVLVFAVGLMAQPAAENAQIPGNANPRGFYALDEMLGFNVLDSVTLEADGRLTLVGHHDTAYAGRTIPYLDHLAELLKNPTPELTLDWTSESETRVATIFRNFNSFDYVQGLARQWTNDIIDENGHPTRAGRWILPAVGIQPTSSGGRLGDLGITGREIQHQGKRTLYERILISTVRPGSAADRAGLLAGDMIQNQHNAVLFRHRTRLIGEGGTDMFQIHRDGKDSALMVTVTLDGIDGDPWAELDRFDIIQKMLAKAGNSQGAMLMYAFGQMHRLMRTEGAGFHAEFGGLVSFSGHNDQYWQDAAEVEAGRMSSDERLARAFQAILGAMENAFEFYDRPLTGAFDAARQSGQDAPGAYDAAIPVFNERIGPYLQKVLGTLMVQADEIQIPPEVLIRTIGGSPVEVAPQFRGVDPHSALARLLYEADYLGKSLINRPDLSGKIPGYVTDFAFERQHPDTAGPWHETGDYHLWYSTEEPDLARSEDGNTLFTHGAKVRMNIRDKAPGDMDTPPIPRGYEELLNSLYEDLAKEFPVLHEAREAAKIQEVAAWLKMKKPDIALPDAGRIRWTAPEKAPGFLYLNWTPNPIAGRTNMALSAVGGYIMRLRARLKELNALTPENERRLEELRARAREEGNRILKEKLRLGMDMPEPVGRVVKTSQNGRDVTAVSLPLPKKGTDFPEPIRLQEDVFDKSLTLWKAEDLAGAKRALNDELKKTDDPRQKASLLLMQARILHENGEEEAAVKSFNEARRLDPDNPMIDILVAQAQYESGDLGAAKKTLQAYTAAHPENKAAAKLLADMQANQTNPVDTPPPSFDRAAQDTPYFEPLEAVKDQEFVPPMPKVGIQLHGLQRPPMPTGLSPEQQEKWSRLPAQEQEKWAGMQRSQMELDQKRQALEDAIEKIESTGGDAGQVEQEKRQTEQQQKEQKKEMEEYVQDKVGWEEEGEGLPDKSGGYKGDVL